MIHMTWSNVPVVSETTSKKTVFVVHISKGGTKPNASVKIALMMKVSFLVEETL